MIIAITGTPCTGKTETAKVVAKELGWEYVSLNDLAAEKNFYLGTDKDRDSKIVDLEKLANEIKKRSRNLIIESHYAHDMPCNGIVVLRCDQKELRSRMEQRNWPEKKIAENLEAEIMEVILAEAYERNLPLLDVETTNAKTTVQKIVSWIKRSFDGPAGT
ncbi:MAG: adenylate kinase family protein [Nanoarchaeota archaeon]|nr:adenylate kinase family protein [Nanoarchaeota archaeon]